MDFDNAPPFDLDEYRRMQLAIPGVDGFYRLLGAVAESAVAPEGEVLIVGAGGGRELEALGPAGFRFTALDPSAQMLEAARPYAAGFPERAAFVHGTVDDLPPEARYDAATALLVMHFLPDDGAKAAFLSAIRARLKPGALYVHADVCFEDAGAFAAMTPAFLAHARLAGLPEDKAAVGPEVIATMPVIGEARARELFAEAGFEGATRFYQGLWYRGWHMRAA